jgi:hypothetical protein
MTAGVPEQDDAQRLESEIERTREQLSETVDQLAAKVDVKSRARAMVAGLTGRVKGITGQAQDRAGGVRSQVAGIAAKTRQNAVSAGQAGTGQLQRRVAPMWEAAPEPARRAVTKGVSAAQRRRGPLLVAAGVLLVGYLAVRQWRSDGQDPAPARGRAGRGRIHARG